MQVHQVSAADVSVLCPVSGHLQSDRVESFPLARDARLLEAELPLPCEQLVHVSGGFLDNQVHKPGRLNHAGK